MEYSTTDCSDVVKKRLIMDTELLGTRVDALDALLKCLESAADKKLDELGPKQ